jgi:transposase-like protein
METPTPPTSEPAIPKHDGSRHRRQPKSYLLKPDYRQIELADIYDLDDQGAFHYLARARWGALGENKQACTACGSVATHYQYPRRWLWKCRDCAKQFTLLAGTRLHGQKISPRKLLGAVLQFVEAKDSISARQISGLNNVQYQTAYVLLMKIREALRETMQAEPKLCGRIQADAAYFMRHVRPGNVGSGRAIVAKGDQKNAGLDEKGKPPKTAVHSPDMHALVVWVQTGEQGARRYKIAMVKDEWQVDMAILADRFCERGSQITTDQHGNYSILGQEFQHEAVNHSKEFRNKAGHHTNLAEGFFSRMRQAQTGSWHRLTIQHLLEYGWEMAWRGTMVGRDNEAQFKDLLTRLLSSGRSTRFGDCWNKRPADEGAESRRNEDKGWAVEVPKEQVPKRRGRPRGGVVRVPAASPRKRPYKRRSDAPDSTAGQSREGPAADTPALPGEPVTKPAV